MRDEAMHAGHETGGHETVDETITIATTKVSVGHSDETTGDVAVDEALRTLHGLDSRPVHEHAAMIDGVHRALQERLADEPADDEPADDGPVDDGPVDDRPVDDHAVGDHPVDDHAVGDHPADDHAVGHSPTHGTGHHPGLEPGQG